MRDDEWEVFIGEAANALVMLDQYSEPKEIDPRTVTYLFLGHKEQEEGGGLSKSHLLRLKTGDRLPVKFGNERIHLLDGYNHSSLKAQSIVHLENNGGLYGKVKEGEAEADLPFSFAKDRHLSLYIPHANVTVSIPWEYIESISAKGQVGAEELRVIPENFAQAEADQEENAKNYSSMTLEDHLHTLNLHQQQQQRQHREAPEISMEEFMLKDPIDMVFIPESMYMLALPAESSSESPLTMVKVAGFFIDTHLVTNAEYKRFVDETEHAQPNHWVNGRIPAGKDDLPVTYVSYKDAQTYAEWVGKRLPTELEWEAAAKKSAAGTVALDNLNEGLSEWASLYPKPDKRSPHKMVRQKMIFDKENNTAQVERIPLKFDDSNNETSFRLVVDTVR